MHGFVLIFINPFITKRPLQEYIKKKNHEKVPDPAFQRILWSQSSESLGHT